MSASVPARGSCAWSSRSDLRARVPVVVVLGLVEAQPVLYGEPVLRRAGSLHHARRGGSRGAPV